MAVSRQLNLPARRSARGQEGKEMRPFCFRIVIANTMGLDTRYHAETPGRVKPRYRGYTPQLATGQRGPRTEEETPPGGGKSTTAMVPTLGGKCGRVEGP